ncbi:unnamed protein product [Brassicogethes aeneus]|uniref:Uncharacterized protein n=1 Tax=Brassicogethes aeneus TaxID=1431903 RepID=A0A9P0FMR3_BRAAE|nr:unnamed protein product [Brassicogethes aeneus]
MQERARIRELNRLMALSRNTSKVKVLDVSMDPVVTSPVGVVPFLDKIGPIKPNDKPGPGATKKTVKTKTSGKARGRTTSKVDVDDFAKPELYERAVKLSLVRKTPRTSPNVKQPGSDTQSVNYNLISPREVSPRDKGAHTPSKTPTPPARTPTPSPRAPNSTQTLKQQPKFQNSENLLTGMNKTEEVKNTLKTDTLYNKNENNPTNQKINLISNVNLIPDWKSDYERTPTDNVEDMDAETSIYGNENDGNQTRHLDTPKQQIQPIYGKPNQVPPTSQDGTVLGHLKSPLQENITLYGNLQNLGNFQQDGNTATHFTPQFQPTAPPTMATYTTTVATVTFSQPTSTNSNLGLKSSTKSTPLLASQVNDDSKIPANNNPNNLPAESSKNQKIINNQKTGEVKNTQKTNTLETDEESISKDEEETEEDNQQKKKFKFTKTKNFIPIATIIKRKCKEPETKTSNKFDLLNKNIDEVIKDNNDPVEQAGPSKLPPKTSTTKTNHTQNNTENTNSTRTKVQNKNNKQPNKKDPPPIVLAGKTIFKHSEIVENLKKQQVSDFTIKHTKNNIILNIKSDREYDKYLHNLKENNVYFHTYTKEENKTHAFIMRGLDAEITLDDIKKALFTEHDIISLQTFTKSPHDNTFKITLVRKLSHLAK